jgi:DNA invertase Pin-like site-specific DNA recombinase
VTRAAVYARKSTSQSDVADEAKSVTRQVAGARAFIAARGWTLDERHVFVDDGVSGALFANRAAFTKMMAAADAGEVEAVVFYDLDRFGRNARQTMLALNTLADLGVTIWDYSTGVQVDLDSFEGEMMTFMKARFAQQFRDQVRKHTRDAMRAKAEQGFVTGSKIFGYTNLRVGKGMTRRVVCEPEAAVVREIFTRFAAGQGLRTIARALNTAGAPSPRAQQGRPSGWSSSTIKSILARPLYRGEVVYGRARKAYGRELGRRATREKGMVAQPEASWVVREQPELRVVDPDLAARVDARRAEWAAATTKHRAPQRGRVKFLLSGGLLTCPTCGGRFEGVKNPWPGAESVYVCSTRRRKPGACANTLRLPMALADEAVLDVVEGEALGTAAITELLALVDRGDADQHARLAAERDRLRAEVANLVASIAAGVPPATVASAVREREGEVAKLDAQLRLPRAERPDVERLRAALEQRAEEWRETLRAEPAVARAVLKRLVGPLTLWDAAAPSAAFVEWEASLTPGLLEGLARVPDGTSPTGTEDAWATRVWTRVKAA